MSTQTDLLDGIRGLARAIQAETQRYVAYTENLHDDCLSVDVAINGGVDGFTWFRGSEHPVTGHETSLEQMRGDMARWLADYRKQEAA